MSTSRQQTTHNGKIRKSYIKEEIKLMKCQNVLFTNTKTRHLWCMNLPMKHHFCKLVQSMFAPFLVFQLTCKICKICYPQNNLQYGNTTDKLQNAKFFVLISVTNVTTMLHCFLYNKFNKMCFDAFSQLH